MTVTVAPPRLVDLIGETKGVWTIVSRAPASGRQRSRWNAKCGCGKEKVIALSNWRSGKGTKTCPCQPRLRNYNQLPHGEASFNMLYGGYIRRARERGYEFDLSLDEFRALTVRPCAYCGKPPSQTRKTVSGTPYTYSGIDRVEPSRGYITGNVVPCCLYCNRAKSDLTLDEWKENIRLLWERLC